MGGDEVVQALLDVRTLIEATVARHRDRRSSQSPVAMVAADDGNVLGTIEEMIAGAERTVDVVFATDVVHARAIHLALHGLLSTKGDAVKVRLLCPPAMFDREFLRVHAARGRPLEVRLARMPMLEAVLVDESAALVCVESGTAAVREASVIRAPSVLRTLYTLLGGVWRHAVPAGEHVDFGGRARTEFAVRILGWLNAGVTDEVAARELSVSVRTYRRYVAEIMELLRANSRFQAGARAFELGLLPGNSQPDRPAQPPAGAARRADTPWVGVPRQPEGPGSAARDHALPARRA
ncbi:LuxR family transcriptional regulator [Kitasatospora sp. NPDC051170]|uniref:LuxR family transcriptional regulator n=1 Tax=Kitasatospora sp. NPDC051170 TaxID=3364056 RepID=UPI00378D393A